MAAFMNEMGKIRHAIIGQNAGIDIPQALADQISRIPAAEVMKIAYEISNMRSATESAYRTLDGLLAAIAEIYKTDFGGALEYLRNNTNISASAIISYAEDFDKLTRIMRENYTADAFHGLSIEDQVVVSYAFWGEGPFSGSTKGLQFLPAMSGGQMGIVLETGTLIAIVAAALLVGYTLGILVEGAFDVTGMLGLFRDKHKQYVIDLECAVKKIEKEKQNLLIALEQKINNLVARGEMTTEAGNEVIGTVTPFLEDIQNTIDNEVKPVIESMKKDMTFSDRIEAMMNSIACSFGMVGRIVLVAGTGYLVFRAGEYISKKF